MSEIRTDNQRSGAVSPLGGSGGSIRTVAVSPTNLAATRSKTPLDDDERRALERALKGLRSALRGMLAELPAAAQNASGLARLLDIERTTCQRVVAAVTPAFVGIELATQLPGTKGLRMLTDAARGRDGITSGIVLDELDRAIDGYDDAIRRIAGSRSRLSRRIAHTLGSAEPDSVLQARADSQSPEEQLFLAASAMTGRSSDVWLAAHAFMPGEDGSSLREARVHGLVGHRARADAVPLTFHVFGDDGGNEPDETDVSPHRFDPITGARDDGVLPAFSSDPIPIVRTKSPGERVVQAIEPSADARDIDPIDLMFGLRGTVSHPKTRDNTLDEVWALVNFPVRRLVLDVFLHRDLARQCIPALDNHLWRPDFASQVGERWQTRFARGPKLEILPPGTRSNDAYPRYEELTSQIFRSLDADPRDFVGHRCDVLFPIWRTGYRMSFDYGGA